MKLKTIIAFIYLFTILALTQSANAQWYLDTATPQEASVRDAPFRYLQNEIQKKLCDNDWGTNKTHFKFLNENPDWRLIVRGKSIHHFTLTSNGNSCIIQLKENSPLYKAMFDKQMAENKSMVEQMQQGKIKMGGPEDKQWNKDNKFFANNREFAQISLNLNDDRIQGNSLQDYRADKVVPLKNIPGISRAILYRELPDKDNPDTSYRAAIYLGNFPKYSGKMEPVHFKYSSAQGWADKQHSGTPILENMSVWIYAYHYNNIMKILHSIDWTGLNAMLKE